MKVGDKVTTRGGFRATVVAMCDNGCVRLKFGSLYDIDTYPEEQLTRFITKDEKRAVYEAAMKLHRMTAPGVSAMTYQINDAKDELKAACQAATP